MSPSASFGNLIKISGITGVLFIMGLTLYFLISNFWGGLVLFFAIAIAVIFALLGVIGIMKRLGML